MSQLLPFVFLGLLLLGLLAYWSRRSKNPGITPAALSDAQKCMTNLQWVLLQSALVERIFAPEDLDFVSALNAPQIRRRFQQERKKLAISWLQHTRRQISALMDLHLRLASYTSNPSPTLEFKLSSQYLACVVMCRVLLILIWLGGPFHARKAVDFVISAADNLCLTFNGRFEDIDAARLNI